MYLHHWPFLPPYPYFPLCRRWFLLLVLLLIFFTLRMLGGECVSCMYVQMSMCTLTVFLLLLALCLTNAPFFVRNSFGSAGTEGAVDDGSRFALHSLSLVFTLVGLLQSTAFFLARIHHHSVGEQKLAVWHTHTGWLFLYRVINVAVLSADDGTRRIKWKIVREQLLYYGNRHVINIHVVEDFQPQISNQFCPCVAVPS